MTQKFKHFETNTEGIDYVCGDVHGHVDLLMELLDRGVNFNYATDRVFFVGDLIDRGPKSFETAELLYNPWVYSVQGNHEQMMIDTILHNDKASQRVWSYNGGSWQYNYEPWQLKDIAHKMNECPLVITVGDRNNRFNVVHGVISHTELKDQHPARIPATDEMIDNWIFNIYDETNMYWGRMLTSAQHLGTKDINEPGIRFHDPSLSLTFCGHTPVNNVIQVERQVFLDTGCGHNINTAKLTIVDPINKVLYSISVNDKKIHTSPLDNIKKYCQ